MDWSWADRDGKDLRFCGSSSAVRAQDFNLVKMELICSGRTDVKTIDSSRPASDEESMRMSPSPLTARNSPLRVRPSFILKERIWPALSEVRGKLWSEKWGGKGTAELLGYGILRLTFRAPQQARWDKTSSARRLAMSRTISSGTPSWALDFSRRSIWSLT